TKEVVLDVDGPSPLVQSAGRNGSVTVLTGASATTKISRKEFGVLWNNLIESMPVVGDEVNITLDLELRRNAPECGRGLGDDARRAGAGRRGVRGRAARRSEYPPSRAGDPGRARSPR